MCSMMLSLFFFFATLCKNGDQTHACALKKPRILATGPPGKSYSAFLRCWAASVSHSSQSVTPSRQETNRTLNNHSVPRELFCFSLSVQYAVNYMRDSTLYCQMPLLKGTTDQGSTQHPETEEGRGWMVQKGL